jgi:ubiquinone/menaquinone biosynthesis C-methylase UbiE
MVDVEQFERWSRTYERSILQKLIFNRVHQVVLALAREFPPPETIVDVGCGTGRLLRAAQLQWPNARLVGVDPAAGMIEVARALTPVATFHVAMAESLPLPDGSADLMFSTTSFHHWQDRAAGVRQVARALRTGGHFILADAYPPAWFTRLFLHERFLGQSQRQNLFEASGLQVGLQKTFLRGSFIATVGKKAAGPT